MLASIVCKFSVVSFFRWKQTEAGGGTRRAGGRCVSSEHTGDVSNEAGRACEGAGGLCMRRKGCLFAKCSMFLFSVFRDRIACERWRWTARTSGLT